jgi:hypothetical protein
VPLPFIWGAQEAPDLSISGWTVGGTQANQGPVPATILASQADTTQIAAQVWKAQTTVLIASNPAVPFFSIPPQTDDRQTRAVWQSLRAGQTPPVIASFYAAPQQVDLTQQALFVKPGLPTGAVPPITSGVQQADTSQIAPNVWKSATAPAVVSGSVPLRSIWASQESLDLSISGWTIGGTQALQGPVPPTIFASQNDPSQIPAAVWGSVSTPPVLTGAVPAIIAASQQTDTTQIAAQVWKAQIAAPIVPSLANFLYAAPQQADFTQQGLFVAPSRAPLATALSSIYAAPQQIDLTQQGWVRGVAPVKQGPVPPFTIVPITDLSQTGGYQIAATIFPSVPPPPPAAPNLHKLYLDVTTGRLYWQVSQTSNPTLIIPL